MLKWKHNVCAPVQPLSPAHILEINPQQSPKLEFRKNILHQITAISTFSWHEEVIFQTYPVSEKQTYVISRVEYVQLHTADTKYRLIMHLPKKHQKQVSRSSYCFLFLITGTLKPSLDKGALVSKDFTKCKSLCMHKDKALIFLGGVVTFDFASCM